MSRLPPGTRGKITAKLAASANQNRQEMNGDDGNWSVVQNPKQGLQTEASGTSGDSTNTNGGDNWGTNYDDSWDTGRFDLDSNTPAKDDTPPEECRECGGPHAYEDCERRPRHDYGGGGGGNRGGGSRGECYGCGQIGHIRRDCTQNSGNRSMGGRRPYGEDRSSGAERPYGNGNNRSYESDRAYGNGGNRPYESDRAYGNGGNRSHESDRSYGASTSPRGNAQCSNCGGRGHNAQQCPSPPLESNDSAHGYTQSSRSSSYSQQSEITCHRCNEQGHFAHQCPKRVGAQTDTENTGPLNRIIETTEAEAENRNRIADMSRFEQTEVKVSNSSGELCNRFEDKVLKTFSGGGLCESLLQMLEKLGFEKPMPVQKYAIPILSEGFDIMARAQTGSGKTAAFILPIVDGLIKARRAADRGNPQRPYGLVLSPTRELCAQITRDAQQYVLKTNPRIKVKECYGGTNVREQRRNICEGCHLLVGTTGRVKQFLEESVICFSELRYLVLDEADRMLDMGFQSDVREIMRFRKTESPLQTLMFSATFPNGVQALARDYLREDFIKLDVGVVGTVNQDVRQTVEEVRGMEAKKSRLVTMVEEDIRNDPHAKILVFTATKNSADAMAVYLSTSGIKTTSMHGDRLQEQRETALADFQNGTCPVLVATEVAGRGLDITDVTHVINFDLPKDIDGYIHRVGRTARAGKTGRATSFFDPAKDFAIQGQLKEVLMDAGQKPPDFL